MTDNIEVSSAIKNLRAQLEDAQREGTDKKVRFLARTVEVELAIVFKGEAEGGAGVKAWLLDVSGKARTGSETSHKLKLILEPVGPDGKPTFVSDADRETE